MTSCLSGYTYVSDNGGGSYDGTTWTHRQPGQRGQRFELQITVTVEASGDYQNIAIVSGNEDRP